MLEALLKGLTFGVWLSLSVGPVLFSIIKQSLNNGHRGGMAFVFGVSLSDILIVLISTVFTQLFKTLTDYIVEIGIAGCIFLVSLGIYYFFFKKTKIRDATKPAIQFRSMDYARIFASGFLMNSLNPAVFIIWIAATTGTVENTLQERIVFFTTCLVFVLASDVAKVFLAGKIRNRLTPRNIHIISKVNGLILIILGLLIIYDLLVLKKVI
jgi:threonine/homoserine/homoserine lactone efflux protein